THPAKLRPDAERSRHRRPLLRVWTPVGPAEGLESRDTELANVVEARGVCFWIGLFPICFGGRFFRCPVCVQLPEFDTSDDLIVGMAWSPRDHFLPRSQ